MRRIIAALLCIMFCASPLVAVARRPEFVPFNTYTFSIQGMPMESPHAYIPAALYGLAQTGLEFRGATNIFVDHELRLFIADAPRNRILVFCQDMQLLHELHEFYADGHVQHLSSPEGMFVHARTGGIFVADTGNRRIVEFDAGFNFVREISAPVADVVPDDFIFLPANLVVDTVGRMFVLVRNNLMGLVQMDAAGEFIGFFGAQRVTLSPFDVIREFFMTEEQRERTVLNVPRQYNNLAIDGMNFVWLTTDAIPWTSINAATMGRARSGTDMPVRRMNMNGDDVLVRGGVFPPTGDVVGHLLLPSAFVDIALRDNLYSVLDRQRNKIFTYDMFGNLLYAFGGTGTQFGVFTQAAAIAWRGHDLLVLDADTGAITVFERTAYGALLEEALAAEAGREFDRAYRLWGDVMRQNNNFEMAYTGIARMMLRRGDYDAAMRYNRFAMNVVGYSQAFGEARRLWIRDNFWVVPVVLLLLVFGVVWWFKFAARINRKHYHDFGRYTIWHELLYGFHVIFHPIGGFWDLRHERRGSMRAANIILGIVTVSFIHSALGTGYIFNPAGAADVNLLQEILNVFLPVVMWCVASWALTTLMDGQARMRDIYIVTCYALLPFALLNFPATLLTNVLILEETVFLTFIRGLAAVWSVLLIFFGVMTLQEYGLIKNALTSVAALVGMGVQMFAGMLFILLASSIWRFFVGIYQEVAFRM